MKIEQSNHSHNRRGAAARFAIWSIGASTLCLALAAVLFLGQQYGTAQPKRQATISPQQLSNSFRNIAEATFPGIVAIETKGKSVQMTNRFDLEDFFKDDPNFKRFFENNPELKPRIQPRQRQRIVPQGQGSGFIIDQDGHILTNNHVVEDAATIKVRLHNGREYEAELVGTDPRSDVAVIKIDAADLQPIPLGNSDTAEVGDWVLAFGSPFGLELTMTQGIISAKGRGPGINEREDYLQTDAAINPGNSGGPLVNLNGEVIGINTAISSRSGGYDGVGFSIPINMAKWISDQLLVSGRVKRAYIGVMIQPVTNDLADQLGLSVNQGAIVSQIVPDSPSDKADLQTGDVILELNGSPVNGTRQLQGIVEQLSVDKAYPLIIYRDGQKKRLKITMAEMPDNLSLLSKSERDSETEKQEPESTTVDGLGMNVQELTDDLAEQFSFPTNVNGVIITNVEPEGIAGLNGLQVGELIEKVGSTQINSIEDFAAAMEKADLDNGVLLLVRRGNFTRFQVLKENP